MTELIGSIQLESIYLLDCDFVVSDPVEAQKGGKLEFGISVSFDDAVDYQELNMTSTVEISGLRDEERIFSLMLKHCSKYTVKDDSVLLDDIEDTRTEYLVNLIYPILREHASSTLGKAGLGQINLPYHFSSSHVSSE